VTFDEFQSFCLPRTEAHPMPDDREQRGFYTAAQVADLLQITKQTALRWMKAGKIPGAVQPNERGVWRVNRNVFDNWIRARSQQGDTV
jgi:excisionase family DNA binding protein